jgi:hypothetical protein
MRDSGYYLRKAFFTALDGQVTFNSNNVPVVDGKLETIPEDGIAIVFGDQSDKDKSNKSVFVQEVTFDLAVIDKRKSTAGKKDVEDVCDQVLDIIKPTVSSHGLTIDSPFVITSIKYLSGLAVSVLLDPATKQYIQVKRIQFIIRISQ